MHKENALLSTTRPKGESGLWWGLAQRKSPLTPADGFVDAIRPQHPNPKWAMPPKKKKINTTLPLTILWRSQLHIVSIPSGRDSVLDWMCRLFESALMWRGHHLSKYVQCVDLSSDLVRGHNLNCCKIGRSGSLHLVEWNRAPGEAPEDQRNCEVLENRSGNA